MTFHLFPSNTHANRRQFLTAAAIAAASTSPAWGVESKSSSSAYFALLADTHIAGDPREVNGRTNMFNNLNRVIDEILADPEQPAGVVINGDCAYLRGLPQDYRTLRGPINRLIDADITVHLTMGNHDDREPFYAALADQQPASVLVEGKHVAVIESGPINLFLVDSLMTVNVVTGHIGDQQLAWLDHALKQRASKPAIVFGHHNPNLSPSSRNGLKDTDAFLDVLHSNSNVQAYFFGHTHHWNLGRSDQGLHLINQPPVAYVFEQSRPNGWVKLRVSDESIHLELKALNHSHVQHNEQHELAIRSLVSTP